MDLVGMCYMGLGCVMLSYGICCVVSGWECLPGKGKVAEC
jgi:hypothetical protein